MTRRGQYYEPMPVDELILGLLPEVGTIGGVHWRGRRVADVVEELNDDGVEVTTTLVAARIRSMHVVGMVRRFRGTSGTIWARVPDGGTTTTKEDQ